MLTDISKFRFQVRCPDKPLKGKMSFFWSLTPGEMRMLGIYKHRLWLPQEVGKDCRAFSCRLGMWGRAIGVTCEDRYPSGLTALW